MTIYAYNEYDETGGHIVEISDTQIIKDYFPAWSHKMRECGKENEISHENCIEDFCVINWAWEESDDE